METKSVRVRLERKALARSGEGGKERVVEGSTVRGRKPSYITVDITVSLCDFFYARSLGAVYTCVLELI